MELGAGGTPVASRGLTMAPVNKVNHVYTIARVAEMLGEDEDWLRDVANEMDQEDGLIWVYGPGDEEVMAFTDFGIETLQGLIEIHKANPDLLKRSTDLLNPAAHAGCLRSLHNKIEIFVYNTVFHNRVRLKQISTFEAMELVHPRKIKIPTIKTASGDGMDVLNTFKQISPIFLL